MAVGLRAGWMCAAMLLVASGCGRSDSMGPPTIHYGQDVCDVCGMIVSDERFAAAAVVIRDGRAQAWLLDDVGELFQADIPAPGGEIGWYVHDMRTGEWVDARAAVYLRADALRTPMAMHLAAFATREEAERAREDLGGEILSYAEVGGASGGTP